MMYAVDMSQNIWTGNTFSLTHGHTRGGKLSPTYLAWGNMKARCTNAARPDWKHYGGRGITVCERWRESFANFLTDMGERPEGLALDRIDVNGNYEPGNCRWATWSEQQRNRRTSSVCKRGHLLQGENVRLDKTKTGYQRTCKTCSNMMHQLRRARGRR